MILKDSDIRKPFIDRLVKMNDKNVKQKYRIISEMAICDGLSRADIVVVREGNGVYGYEIKSDADTLDRLSSQQESYSKTFDKAFIIVGEKHKLEINNFIPEWWGVYVVRYDKKNDSVLFKLTKRGRKNKFVSVQALLDLLWREEVETLLKQHGIKGLSGKNRRILRQIAIEHISFQEISDYTRETLLHRQNWR